MPIDGMPANLFVQALPAANEQIGRHAVDRLGDLPVFADDPDAARTLADDDPAVGKKTEAEGRGESFSNGLDVVRGRFRRS